MSRTPPACLPAAAPPSRSSGTPASLAHRAGRAFSRLAGRRGLAILIVGLASFGGNAAMTLIRGVPLPEIHDEFCYLLAADTFDRGRLSNPTHPLWVHFETMHVLQRPSYAPKYPPGQGLLLAAGRRIGGREVVGAWLGGALACAAACWMLMAWTRPRWALAGGLLAAAHPTAVGWAQSYWGGGLAMLAGSLLLGGARRAATRPGWREGLAMGSGMALLAVSRPYEGMALSVGTLAALALGRARAGGLPAVLATARAIPAALVPLTLVFGLIAANNLAVTGRIGRLPYAEYEATYSNTPILLIQRPGDRPITFRNETMRTYYEGWVADSYDDYGRFSPAGRVAVSLVRALALEFPVVATAFDARRGAKLDWDAAILAIPWLLIPVPLILRPTIAWARETRGATILLAWFTVALMVEVWKQSHYAAPAFGLVVLLHVRSLRHWAVLGPWDRAVGRTIRRALFVMALAWPWALADRGRVPSRFATDRALVEANLREAGGDHLVVVRYAADHPTLEEWVYNQADIDGSRVVWARDLGDGPNRRLLDHFRDRKTWLLEPDAQPRRLVPYPGTSPSPTSGASADIGRRIRPG